MTIYFTLQNPDDLAIWNELLAENYQFDPLIRMVFKRDGTEDDLSDDDLYVFSRGSTEQIKMQIQLGTDNPNIKGLLQWMYSERAKPVNLEEWQQKQDAMTLSKVRV